MTDFETLIGDPAQVAKELKSFRRTAKRLSSNRPRMIERYPRQWVGLYEGRVRAHGETQEEVLKQIDDKNLPRARTLVRFIDPDPKAMIL